LTTLDDGNWRGIEQYLSHAVPKLASQMPEGKIQLGLSVYGIRTTTQQLLATGLTLKKSLKKGGHSVRLIPNQELELGSASVLHNHLTGPTGCEILIVRSGSSVIIAQTTSVQDIDSYTWRDRGRPKRDAKVGMLPPKLAQIIINLARPTTGGVILDPFCGTGVLLQEALLMGYGVYGSDLEPRMIDYSRENIAWLKSHEPWLARNIDTPNSHNNHDSTPVYLEVQDATKFQNNNSFSAVACETYLGRPFTDLPSPDILHQTIADCNLIISKFLRAIQPQLPPGARLCLAVPAWQVRPGTFKHLPLLDSLAELGYNRISFEHVRDESLVYHRADQIVARELLVVTNLAS
jgi:tRNA (guanine10-N2)-dimethyltransferase